MFLGAALLAASLSNSAPTPRAEPLVASERYTLKNGLRVVLHQDHSQPLVAVRVLYKVGTANDPPQRQGMTHLLEHTLFQSSLHIERPLRSELYRLGAVGVNGTTTPDELALYETVPRANLAAALRVESDRMAFPVIDAETMTEEKFIIEREHVERESAGEWAAARYATLRALFPVDHPIHPATDATMSSIGVVMLKEHARRALVPNNAILVLAGDLPVHTRRLVARYFGSLPTGPTLEPPSTPPMRIEGETRVALAAGASTVPVVMVGWRLGSDHALDPVADLVAQLIHRRTLALRTLSSTDAIRVAGTSWRLGPDSVFMLRAGGGAGEDPTHLLRVLEDALTLLASTPPTQRELAAVKKRLAVSSLRRLGSLEGRAAHLASSEAQGTDDLLVDWLDNLERVDAAAVSSLASKLGKTRDRVVLVRTPEGPQ